jgi:GNAT superfamily N-acetyltransferase
MTTVRPAGPGDGPGCAAVWIDAGRYYQALDPHAFQIPAAAGLAASFENDIAAAGPDQLHLVADPGDGTVSGLLVAALQHPGTRPDHELVRDQSRLRLYIRILAVVSAHRRTGTGTALLTAAQTWAAGRGATVALLDTYLRSPTSVPFYEHRMGYTRRAVVFRRELG